MTDKMFTTRQVMDKLNVSKKQVYSLMKGGELKAMDISKPGSIRKRYRFHEEDVNKFIRRREVSGKDD